MIVILTGVTAVLSGIISFLLPNIYCATIKILLSQQYQGDKLSLMQQMGGLTGFSGDILGGNTTIDMYL